MKYKIERKNWGCFFSVPCEAVQKHIKLCSGDFFKVLLCILSSEENEIVSEDISCISGINIDIVDDAIVYWSQAGIFSVLNVTVLKNNNAKAVIANDSHQVSNDIILKPYTGSLSNETQKVSIVPSVNPTKNSLERKSHVKYSAKDVADIINSQIEIKEMFSQLEVILKRNLKFSEQCGYINLVENYGFPAASILLLVQYCEDIGKSSIKYIEKIANDWFEQDITSYPQVEAQIIKMTNSHTIENKVSKIFGMTTALTKKQKEYINSWTDLGFNPNMIELAYERCVNQINKLSFPYINKILTNWSKDNAFTAEEVNILDTKGKKSISKTKEKEHSFDLDEFDEFTLNYVPQIKGKEQRTDK